MNNNGYEKLVIADLKNEVNEFNLYEMIKFKMKDVNESKNIETGEKVFCIRIQEEKIHKKTTLIKENEIIRIINELNMGNLSPRKDKNGKESGFPFVRDLFSMNVSTEEYGKNQTGLVTVIFEARRGIKTIEKAVQYKRLLASTSNIRNKKIIYIKEDLYDKANEILLGGMPVDMEHKQFSKYSAYYALASTDSIPVSTPGIAVIDDFKNNTTGLCDLVKEEITNGKVILHKKTEKPLIDKKTGEYKIEKDLIEYHVDNNQDYTVRGNKPFDGAGLVDVHTATKWSYELDLDYLPSSFQFRCKR
jgi:hypothetical protein